MPALADPDFEAFLALAHALADQASAVILPHFRTDLRIDHKDGTPFDPVTVADRAAETTIRATLAKIYPGHGIMGEELGSQHADADYCWVIDPIDGTRAFILGQPLWGILIGLLHQGRPLLGLMHQPFTGERFYSGARDAFFRRNDGESRLRTRAGQSLSEAFLACTTPDMFEEEEERQRFETLSGEVRLRRFGGDCYNYCLLAMGKIDLVVEAGLKPFDILPLMPIIERAGGVVTTWDGGDARSGGRILAAGDARLHAEAIQALTR
jgi:histidinol phosphatase-like enzyme (inositol monophosphatase family)